MSFDEMKGAMDNTNSLITPVLSSIRSTLLSWAPLLIKAVKQYNIIVLVSND